MGGERDGLWLSNDPACRGWKTPHLNLQVRRGPFWPLLTRGPLSPPRFKCRMKRRPGRGRGLQRGPNLGCCFHCATLGEPLSSWHLRSPLPVLQGPFSSPVSPLPFLPALPPLGWHLQSTERQGPTPHPTGWRFGSQTPLPEKQLSFPPREKQSSRTQAAPAQRGAASCFHGGDRGG